MVFNNNYVSKNEFDELKRKFNELNELVHFKNVKAINDIKLLIGMVKPRNPSEIRIGTGGKKIKTKRRKSKKIRKSRMGRFPHKRKTKRR